VDTFLKQDMPRIMTTSGMADQALPVVWTSDIILGPRNKNVTLDGVTKKLGKVNKRTVFHDVQVAVTADSGL
jgi:hypothetical protein